MDDEKLKNKLYEYLDEENCLILYNFIIDTKNSIKRNQLLMLHGFGSNGKDSILNYISRYIVTHRVSYVQTIDLKSLKYLKDENKNKLIYVDSNNIDFNILNILLNRDNKWNFISKTNDIRLFNSLLFTHVNFKKVFTTKKLLKDDNFEIYSFNIYSKTDNDIFTIKLNINFIHTISFKLNTDEFNNFISFIKKIKENENIIFKNHNIILAYSKQNFSISIENEKNSTKLYFKCGYFFKRGIDNFIS